MVKEYLSLKEPNLYITRIRFFKDDTYVIITEFADNQILICSELSGIWIYDFGARLNNKSNHL